MDHLGLGAPVTVVATLEYRQWGIRVAGMEFLHHLVVLLHLIGFAALVGGGLVQARAAAPEINRTMVLGGWAQVLTGLILVGFAEVGPDQVNHLKIGVKLLLAVAVLVLVVLNRKYASIPRGLLGLIVGLSLSAASVAVLWQ